MSIYTTHINRHLKKPAKAAQKKAISRASLTAKIKAMRWALAGKSFEDTAQIMGVSKIQVRNKLTYLYKLFGVYCNVAMSHSAHAMDMVFTCDKELEDWLANHNPMRRKA